MFILESWGTLEEDLDILFTNALLESQNLAIHLG